MNAFKRVCKKRFPANEAEIKTPALYHKYKWQEKLKNPQWYPFHMVEVEEGKFKVFIPPNSFPSSNNRRL